MIGGTLLASIIAKKGAGDNLANKGFLKQPEKIYHSLRFSILSSIIAKTDEGGHSLRLKGFGALSRAKRAWWCSKQSKPVWATRMGI